MSARIFKLGTEAQARKRTMLRTPFGPKDHARGARYALVQLVEYGDYECSQCRRAAEVVKRVVAALQDDLVFCWRQFPLPQIHPFALNAAKAAEAASRQGKFWRMHDVLLDATGDLDTESLLAHAESVDLDMLEFSPALRSPEISAIVSGQFVSGIRSGVSETPSFFINNLQFEGVWSYENLLKACRQAWLEARRQTRLVDIDAA